MVTYSQSYTTHQSPIEALWNLVWIGVATVPGVDPNEAATQAVSWIPSSGLLIGVKSEGEAYGLLDLVQKP